MFKTLDTARKIDNNALMRGRWNAAAGALMGCAALLLPLAVSAEDDPTELPPQTEDSVPSEASDQPIVVELANGVDLLNEQIASQEGLLKTAQTDRERQLIRNHIRSLQKERRSLESLLLKLIGPDMDILESVREQQNELRSQRYEQTLESDSRPENLQ